VRETLDQLRAICLAYPEAEEAGGVGNSSFFVPPYVGSKGWIGAYLDVEQDWDELAELIDESYRMTALKKLVAQLPSDV
jgi:predicted DNA-binding protein (MmcQ/YjbR family)